MSNHTLRPQDFKLHGPKDSRYGPLHLLAFYTTFANAERFCLIPLRDIADCFDLLLVKTESWQSLLAKTGYITIYEPDRVYLHFRSDGRQVYRFKKPETPTFIPADFNRIVKPQPRFRSGKVPIAARLRALLYRASALKLPINFTEEEWVYALEYWHYCCAVCGRQQGFWHVIAADHWIAISDPRPDNPGTVATNILPLCHGINGCNNAKGGRDPHEWLMEKFSARKAKKIEAAIAAYFASVKENMQSEQLSQGSDLG